MPAHSNLFPSYIPRKTQSDEILQILKDMRVTTSRKSFAILLYGEGGTGKTTMVRYLASKSAPANDGVKWLLPVDVDDSEFWLIPNLEKRIAQELDPEDIFFSKYTAYMSELPNIERQQIGHETVLAYLHQGSRVFVECYSEYITKTGIIPVVTFDTVESIRTLDILLSLTQWLKELPGTLFIVSGRPALGATDQIVREFDNPIRPIEYRKIVLSRFKYEEAIEYLTSSDIGSSLLDEELAKIAILSRGRALWLALAVNYLDKRGVLPEVKEQQLVDLENWLPYDEEDENALLPQGRELLGSFVGHLIMPQNGTDFWAEATRRLAVVHHNVNFEIWTHLMVDVEWPPEMSPQQAWAYLQALPWIRLRANRQFVTLHDAVAETLAKGVIPLSDRTGEWRKAQWNNLIDIYNFIIDKGQKNLVAQQASLINSYNDLSASQIIDKVKNIDSIKQENNQLNATCLFYKTLVDFEAACQEFILLFDTATKMHDYRLRALAWLEMQRFLPSEISSDPLEIVIRNAVNKFRAWLKQHVNIWFDIIERGARYLIDSGQPEEADKRLSDFIEKHQVEPEKKYTLITLQGTARMKAAGQVVAAERDFAEALKLTESKELKQYRSEARNLMGLYYRNVGKWAEAADSYLQALVATPFTEQIKRANIQSNWAYVQALQGRYTEAHDLVDGALKVRRARGLERAVGMALSVKGEIYRYSREYAHAWLTYREAEEIFQKASDWPWLGMIYQEEAICLFQSSRFGILVDKDFATKDDVVTRAQNLARQALDICSRYNLRAYPSALNRASRILGRHDFVTGLNLLIEGIKWAREVNDGWFLLANLIEYAELCYRGWQETGDIHYRENIGAKTAEIEQAQSDYQFFNDLSGRWDLLRAHLLLHDSIETNNSDTLRQSLDLYKVGFPKIAKGFYGSHGATEIAAEFKHFGNLLSSAPSLDANAWCDELTQAWSTIDPKHSTALLAKLTEVYEDLMAATAGQKK
jgi:tetratricopeptide (TPR) repeat protein